MESTRAATASSGVGHGGSGEGAAVLLLPFPGAQGHTNPMLELGRRVARTASAPRSSPPATCSPPPRPPARPSAWPPSPTDSTPAASCPDPAEYFSRLEAVGPETLRELLLSEEATSVRVLVYDSHLPWAGRVARAAGVPAAASFSQPCAVNDVYGEVWAGGLALPVTDGRELLARGALGVELGPEDVPPFASAPESLPVFLKTSIEQFDGLEDADDVLVNSFSEIEPTEVDYMKLTRRVKTTGPTLPSFYLGDDRLPSNKSYDFNFFVDDAACMGWLQKQSISSVVLVSVTSQNSKFWNVILNK